jgi:beta-glucanase (GH16 family)
VAVAGCSEFLSAAPATITNARYRLVWHDEFKGSAKTLPSRHNWRIIVGGAKFNHELEYYSDSPANVSLNGRGDLAITARRQHHAGRHRSWQYTSARLETLGRFHVRYGKIEARIKIPAGDGLWPTFWMLGTNYPRVGWPDSGELDMMEFRGQNPFELVATVHGPAATHKKNGWQSNSFAQSKSPFSNSFHVYGVNWTRDQIVFTLDGVAFGTVVAGALLPRDRWVFNRPFYMLLNLAVGGYWVGPPTLRTTFPATMLVDWVRVWKRAAS